MKLKRNGTQDSANGPPQCFTGIVRIDLLFSPTAPARTGAPRVTFEPGARSHWHTRPLGRKLVVTCGCGYVQSWVSDSELSAPAMWSNARPGRSTGTAPRQALP